MAWQKLTPLHPLIRGLIVVTLIPPDTSPQERAKVEAWSRRLKRKVRHGKEYRRFCRLNGIRPRFF